MAVSMFQSSYRADFMISDAALPQRMAEMTEMSGMGASPDKDQAAFAKILNDVGGASETGVPDKELLVVESSNSASMADDLPQDTMELARKIIKGEKDIKDLPPEKITIELLQALAIVRKLENPKDEDEDEDTESETLFDPAEAAVFQQSFSGFVQDQMLMELYRFIEKHNEREAEDKVTILDGISEALPENPELADTLPFPIDAEKESEDASVFEQIIDSHVEAVAEEQERANVDTFVRSDAPKVEAAEESEVSEVLEQAVRNGEVGKPEVRVTEKAEKPEAKTPEAPKATNERVSRSKEVSEELEMLKNAKLGKSVKTEDVEDDGEPELPNSAAGLLDTPIVITAKDGREIEVKPSEVVAQATKLVEQAVSENKEQTEYSLVLNPEELGKITVKLTKAADGAVSVTIAAESARTQRILEQNSALMQNNLKSSGIQLESWQTVNESQQETLAQDYNGSSKNPYYRDDDPKQDEESDEKSFAEIIAAM